MEIRVTRRSVCAGDDAFVPHEEFIPYSSDEKLSEWLDKLIEYLPKVKGCSMWKVYADSDLLLCIVYGNEEDGYHFELAVPDCNIAEMGIKEIHCKYFSELDMKFMNERKTKK